MKLFYTQGALCLLAGVGNCVAIFLLPLSSVAELLLLGLNVTILMGAGGSFIGSALGRRDALRRQREAWEANDAARQLRNAENTAKLRDAIAELRAPQDATLPEEKS